jgi:hypothetical protein
MADRDRLALAYSRQKDKLKAWLLQDFGALNYQVIEDALAGLGSYAVTEDFQDLYLRLKKDVEANQAKNTYERPLPVRPREQVVDEWGGLMKLHDDVQRLAEIEQRQLDQAKKLTYRRELEEQIRQSKLMKQEIPGRTLQSRSLSPNAWAEDEPTEAKRKLILARIREESREDFHRAEEHRKAQELLQREEFAAKLRYEAQKDKIENDVSRLSKLKDQQRVNEANRMLMLSKHEAKQREREHDKAYAKVGFVTSDSNEMRRKKYLEDNRIRNDEMVSRLLQFKPKADVTKSADSLSFHDQIRQEREELDRLRAIQMKQDQAEVLKRQMMERQKVRTLERHEDSEFATRARDHSFAALNYEKDLQLQEKWRQKQYRSELQKQIDERNAVKAQSHSMSNIEQKLNRPSLEAFRRGLPEVYSKLPGVPDKSSVSPGRPLLSRGTVRNSSHSPSFVRDRSYDRLESSPLKQVHRAVLGRPSPFS